MFKIIYKTVSGPPKAFNYLISLKSTILPILLWSLTHGAQGAVPVNPANQTASLTNVTTTPDDENTTWPGMNEAVCMVFVSLLTIGLCLPFCFYTDADEDEEKNYGYRYK
tara:strand:+ start:78 stop:407 length:330 start_codon:yes stop_codon:yes gene_type:complete